MATSTQGQVLSLQGSVKAIGVDGKVRILKVGDILQPGEQLQLENGASVSISRADGEVMHLDGDRQVTLTEEVLHAQHADAAEASIAPLAPEAQQILAALDNPAANPGNPFDSLDPAAAGLNDAGGENSGHSFVRIGRISESRRREQRPLLRPHRPHLGKPDRAAAGSRAGKRGASARKPGRRRSGAKLAAVLHRRQRRAAGQRHE
ncbi:retention module-containing protein, partial [Chromobacterium piscinae]|uniref:retention module-containing protein n=1 Tax=Chromobacterium piscinae TaxID=686831 RepID=UPI0032612719